MCVCMCVCVCVFVCMCVRVSVCVYVCTQWYRYLFFLFYRKLQTGHILMKPQDRSLKVSSQCEF